MAVVLKNGKLVIQYFQDAALQVQTELKKMPDDNVLANDEEVLSKYFITKWELEPVTQDFSRNIKALQEKDFQQRRSGDFFDGPKEIELIYSVIEIPLEPRSTNSLSLQLRANPWPIYSPIEARGVQFRDVDHMLILRVFADQVKTSIETIKQMLNSINVDLLQQQPAFKSRVLEIVRQRKLEVSKNNNYFEQQMKELGIEIKKRSDAIEPINVQVKHSVQILREKTPQSSTPSEPQLTYKSVTDIVGLIDQSGKGFETSPSTYSTLAEEQLRDIIVGHLNAVFEINAATRETFSKKGKTDIFLNTPGGVVLIAECKIWGGQKLYSETIDQLFGYLTWRHTIGIMITFSRNKGLTKVYNEAAESTKCHPSFRNDFSLKTQTYFISNHEHPNDLEKTIEVHHLFFDLYPG